MEWLRISTTNMLVRVATEEIVFVRADGNYSDLVLTNGKTRNMPFQLHYFEDAFQKLNTNMFVRLGRSLIVNKRYIYIINLTDGILIFSGQEIKAELSPIRVSREALKALKEQLQQEAERDNNG
jgi:DNA-binding LytR/AlgR family response regulator